LILGYLDDAAQKVSRFPVDKSPGRRLYTAIGAPSAYGAIARL
jgi:hypothetical protein